MFRGETLQICFVNLCWINFPVGGVRSLTCLEVDPVSVWWQQMVGLEAQRLWRYLQTVGNPRQQIHTETGIQFQMSWTTKSQPRDFKAKLSAGRCAGLCFTLTAHILPLIVPWAAAAAAGWVVLLKARPTSQRAGFQEEQELVFWSYSQ